jgi:hypothetical protein
MQTVAPNSLLNEASFLAELASLDRGLTTKRQSPVPDVEQRYEALPDVSGPVRTTPPGMFADESEPAAVVELHEGPSVLGQVAAAAMFVLMMGVGAAGAAVVFHEQVARILAGLRIQ